MTMEIGKLMSRVINALELVTVDEKSLASFVEFKKAFEWFEKEMHAIAAFDNKPVEFELTKKEKAALQNHVMFPEDGIDDFAKYFPSFEGAAPAALAVYQQGYAQFLRLPSHTQATDICKERGFPV